MRLKSSNKLYTRKEDRGKEIERAREKKKERKLCQTVVAPMPSEMKQTKYLMVCFEIVATATNFSNYDKTRSSNEQAIVIYITSSVENNWNERETTIMLENFL